MLIDSEIPLREYRKVILHTITAAALLLSVGTLCVLMLISNAKQDRETEVLRQLEPVIQQFQRENDEAAQKAAAMLHGRFDRYRDGAELFATDLTRFRSRLALMWHWMPDALAGLVNESAGSARVSRYVARKFEMHVLTREELVRAVEEAAGAYRTAVLENRGQLVRNAVDSLQSLQSSAQLSCTAVQVFQRELDALLAGSGNDNLNTLALSSLTGAVVDYIVARVILAAAMVSGAATFMAASSGTGLAGPASLAIGLVVSFAIGTAIDTWMSRQLAENITLKTQAFLTQMEALLLNGWKNASGNAHWTGLHGVFQEANEQLAATAREALHHSLKEALS